MKTLISPRAAQVARDFANEEVLGDTLAPMKDEDTLRTFIRRRYARNYRHYRQRCRAHWQRGKTFREHVMRRLLPMAAATARRHKKRDPTAEYPALETLAMEELLEAFWEVWEAATDHLGFWERETAKLR